MAKHPEHLSRVNPARLSMTVVDTANAVSCEHFMSDAQSSISRPPTQREVITDKLFRGLTYLFAWLTVLLVVYIVAEIGSQAAPAINRLWTRLKFLVSPCGIRIRRLAEFFLTSGGRCTVRCWP